MLQNVPFHLSRLMAPFELEWQANCLESGVAHPEEAPRGLAPENVLAGDPAENVLRGVNGVQCGVLQSEGLGHWVRPRNKEILRVGHLVADLDRGFGILRGYADLGKGVRMGRGLALVPKGSLPCVRQNWFRS